MQQFERQKVLIIEESEEKTGDHEINRLKIQLSMSISSSKRVNKLLLNLRDQLLIFKLEQLGPATDTSSNNKEQRALHSRLAIEVDNLMYGKPFV
jgi:hypothetical protein